MEEDGGDVPISETGGTETPSGYQSSVSRGVETPANIQLRKESKK